MAITILPTGFEGFADSIQRGIELGAKRKMAEEQYDREEKLARLKQQMGSPLETLQTLVGMKLAGIDSPSAMQNFQNTMTGVMPDYEQTPQEDFTMRSSMGIPQQVQRGSPLTPVGWGDALAKKQIGFETDRMIRRGIDAKVMEKEALAPIEKDIRVDETIATEKAKLDVKRSVFAKDLDSFLAIDDKIQNYRGKGIDRFSAGVGMSLAGFKQDSGIGAAVATQNAATKRLRVQLVRAAGDVGNINIVEQKAAEQMVPTRFDSQKTAILKRAYLKQISKAIDDNSEDEVKKVLASFMQEEPFLASVVTVYDEKLGKTLRIPKDMYEEYKKDRGLNER